MSLDFYLFYLERSSGKSLGHGDGFYFLLITFPYSFHIASHFTFEAAITLFHLITFLSDAWNELESDREWGPARKHFFPFSLYFPCLAGRPANIGSFPSSL